MSPDRDIREEVEREMNRTTPNWGLVRMLLEEMIQQRKQTALVAKKLLGNRPTRKKCPNCRARGMVETFCGTCFGTGEVLNDA